MEICLVASVTIVWNDNTESSSEPFLCSVCFSSTLKNIVTVCFLTQWEVLAEIGSEIVNGWADTIIFGILNMRVLLEITLGNLNQIFVKDFTRLIVSLFDKRLECITIFDFQIENISSIGLCS